MQNGFIEVEEILLREEKTGSLYIILKAREG
jgi:hypothetical protein